ncbi:MAG: hypothetical protein RI945_212 [Candidatus Parcubacteria bacterium]|jgi:hypothetical protein
MKKLFKKYGEKIFMAFLFVYAGTMLIHAINIKFSLWPILAFVLGLGLAIIAHAKKNYITIALLLVHMSIEWFEWSQINISIKTAIFNIAHIMMDLVFLNHELKAHAPRWRKSILSLTFIFLMAVFTYGNLYPPNIEGLVETIEPFVVGGVLGCILSHLYFHLAKEVKNKI